MIDDILAWNDEEAISCDHILERLQKKLDRDLTAQRHLVKSVIIERLKRLPVPQTAARSDERGAESSHGTAAVTIFNTTSC